MKTKDKDLLVNPLADVKPPREGPTFVERKTKEAKKLWSTIKEALSEWSFGSHSPRKLGPPRRRPPAPPRFTSGSGQTVQPTCPLCGTKDCLDREQMQRLRRKSGSLGNTLLRSCEVRRQLKEMEKFRVRTSSGDEVWMTKQGRIQRPKPTPPPPPPPVRDPETKLALSAKIQHDEELEKLKAENLALKILMDDKIAERMKIEKAKDDEMKAYHDKKNRLKHSEDATKILTKIRRTRPPVR